jgi:CRISPR-associated protein Cmr3
MFGGDQTFGALGDKEAGSYLVKSRMFPQQTALLGMVKRELMTQAGVLTRKRKGEWVDKGKKVDAINLVGYQKFDMLESEEQDLGAINTLSPLFLMHDNQRYLKKVESDFFPYVDGKLEGYDPKKDIYDNFISLDGGETKTSDNFFQAIEQTGNKKGGEENSLFKKTSFLFKTKDEDDLPLPETMFAFYLDVDVAFKDSIVSLGADGSKFKMQVMQSDKTLDYTDRHGYLTLLSDSYITLPIKKHCDFAITSEISHRNLTNKKHVSKASKFEKSQTLYLYEKGSVFINPSKELITHLNNKNLQQIGYNIYTLGEKK